MTNSPIPGDVVARLRKGCLHATWDDPEGGKIYTGQVDVAAANGTMSEAADLIEALQRELEGEHTRSEAWRVAYEKATEASAESHAQASSARRLAPEALTEICDAVHGDGPLARADDSETIDQIGSRAGAAIRDIKGARAEVKP